VSCVEEEVSPGTDPAVVLVSVDVYDPLAHLAAIYFDDVDPSIHLATVDFEDPGDPFESNL
jgi:hypothetical protein